MDDDDIDEGSDYEPYGNEGAEGDGEADQEGSQVDEDDGDDDAEDGDDDDDEEDDDDDDDDDDDEDEDEDDDDDENEDEDEAMDVDEAASQQDEQKRANRGLSPTAYLQRAEDRRRGIRPSQDAIDAKGYSVEPAAACPHAAHIHAMALSGDGTILVSGGSDGHVRRYDVYATMNGKSMLTLGVRHGFVEGVTKGGVLHSWWANEEISAVKQEALAPDDRLVSPVHSLALQKDALWALSGTQSGNINLCTVRHDPGATHHVLRRHREPVSALALGHDETNLLSGGWDKGVHQWDLNTGQVVRSYPGHGGQISALSFRPLGSREALSRRQSPESERRSASVNSSQDERDGEQGSQGQVKGEPEEAEDTDMAASNAIKPSSEEERREGDLEQNAATQPTASEPAPSAGVDDLDFEAELHKSLGMNGGDPTDALANGSNKPPDSQAEASRVEAPSRRASKSDVHDDGNGDNDSLFGDGSENDGGANSDGEADADADADIDAEGDIDVDGEGEADAEGEEDEPDAEEAPLDPPVARMVNPSEGKTGAAGVSLPGLTGQDLPGSSVNGINGNTPLPMPAPRNANSALQNPASSSSRLKQSALGGLTTTEGFDADYRAFSNDVFLSATLGGQVMLWDRRAGGSSSAGQVRALPLPEKTPPWCASAIWAPDGERIYVGRRNESVEEWDMRALSSSSSAQSGAHFESLSSQTWSGRRKNPALSRTLRFPSSSGPVTSLAFMPNGRHLVCGSYDNVRLWNLGIDNTAKSSAVPFRIVAGHHGGMISSLAVDPSGRFLMSASGDRGWISSSTETILISLIESQS